MTKPEDKQPGDRSEAKKMIRFSDGDLLPFWMGDKSSFIYNATEKPDYLRGDKVTLSVDFGPDEISEMVVELTDTACVDLSGMFRLSGSEIATFPGRDVLTLYKALANPGRGEKGGHCLAARFKAPKEAASVGALGKLLCEQIAAFSDGRIGLDDMAFSYQILRNKKSGKLSREFEISFLSPVDEENLEDFVDWLEEFTEVSVWHDPGSDFWGNDDEEANPSFDLKTDFSNAGDPEDEGAAPVGMVTIAANPDKLLRRISRSFGTGPG